jgi:hypothetical protein
MENFKKELFELCVKHGMMLSESECYEQDDNGDEVSVQGDQYFRTVNRDREEYFEMFHTNELAGMLKRHQADTNGPLASYFRDWRSR